MEKFPPRPVSPSWDATTADRFALVRRMLAPPFLADGAQARQRRKLTLLKTLDWLELHPGTTWQERWDATGAGIDGRTDWRDRMLADLRAAGAIGSQGERHRSVLGMGLVQLIGGDVLRPALPWLLSTGSPTRIAAEMARVRDPGGIAALKALREASAAGDATFTPAVERVALIMAAKGGLVSDITPGDCVELLDCCSRLFTGGGQQAWRHSPFFYQLLHSAGIFPASAPATVRMISTRFPGQLTAEQLVDRYDLACRPSPRPARGLPARAAARHRLQHPERAGHHAGAAVLERPGNPSSGHRLAPAAARHRRRLEAAHPDQDRPHARRRGAGRRQGSRLTTSW